MYMWIAHTIETEKEHYMSKATKLFSALSRLDLFFLFSSFS